MATVMLPREHGAYGQLTFPLVTALAIAGVTIPAAFTALAVCAAFLAHEPLLVVIGRRGPRARREYQSHATMWVFVTGTAALAAGAAAIRLAPAGSRWSFLVPLVPAAVLAGTMARDREKSVVGEIAAALAFSFAAIPVCVVAGTSIATAFAVGLAFAALFAASTLAVRVVVLKVRGGGNPGQVRTSRRLLLTMTCAVVAALVITAARAVLPWATLLAISPGLLVAVVVAFQPPAPARLRALGWTLVSTSMAAALILIAALARTP